jgi:hypothetical protein
MSILAAAEEIAAALESAGVPYPLTVTREVPASGGVTFDPLLPTIQTYQARGWIDAWRDDDFTDGFLVQRSDLKIVVVAGSIDILPAAGDRITVQDQNLTVISVAGDPAGATYTVQARA